MKDVELNLDLDSQLDDLLSRDAKEVHWVRTVATEKGDAGDHEQEV